MAAWINLFSSISYLTTHWRAGGYTFLALTIFLACVSIITLLLTATDDPGIIPRQSVEPGNVVRNPRTGFPLPKEVVVKGHTYSLKYCGRINLVELLTTY